MKAAQITEYGDASVVKVVEAEQPSIKEGKVLVKVKASSLNPFDTMVRAGYLQEMTPLHLPVTLGGDIAGEVIKVGDGVENVAVGDTVYGQANVVAGNSGAFAEYAATVAAQVAKAPSNITIQEVASLPLIGTSAIQALEEHINLQPNQKILITGGAGGIGQIAIQIAKNLGAYVATTATGGGIEAVKSLGVDQVFDYKSDNYTQSLSNYDAVFDTVGGEELKRIVSILKNGGIAVSMVGEPEKKEGVTVISQMTHVTTEKLNRLRELVESGIVKPNVDQVFSLNEIQDAFTTRESGNVAGKVVLNISA